MKKILALLSGIMLLATILAAAGCGPSGKKYAEGIKDSTVVIIYLKAIEINGEMHLEMYDSNDPNKIVVDTLCSYVKQGGMVIWERVKKSGIKKIKKVGPPFMKGKIFKADAKKIGWSQKHKLDVPDDAEGKEKYDIRFMVKKKEWVIDPYIRIPPPPAEKEGENGPLP